MERFVLILFLVLTMAGCSLQRKVFRIQEHNLSATLSLSDEGTARETVYDPTVRDTLRVVGDDGKELLIMKAIRDENGEMVATDFIDAAVVTARFRNVAERGGKVDLRFDISVPAEMQESRWQLRFYPRMEVLGDTVALEPVLITGNDYRRAQLRGYQQYERFLRTIITDSSGFRNNKELEIFIERNMPEVYALKRDTSFVSDESFKSLFGVTQVEAVNHYTNMSRVRSNDRKIQMKDKMFSRYVKAPIVSEGLRLDTVVVSDTGGFTYEYVQSLNVRPLMKNVGIILSGDIYQEDQLVYSMPDSEPLTFYISSLSSFVDDTHKFKTRILERKVQVNTVCWIDFDRGSWVVDPSTGGNQDEMERIRANLRELLDNREFDIDSILVTASCSPEGSYSFNADLSGKRSRAVADYFSSYIDSYRDSLRAESGFFLDLDGTAAGPADDEVDISFITSMVPENWERLSAAVQKDESISEGQKAEFAAIMEEQDYDRREKLLAGMDCSDYIRETLYPLLRTVEFDFFLHRKGMAKDTVHTMVIDENYEEGVQAIRDRDYKKAVTLLREYRDINTAIAYTSLDYNASAMEVLEGLPVSDKVEYLKAVLYSRTGDDQAAVQHYLKACKMNGTYVHRGNLDPEISQLKTKYNLTENQYE